MMTLNEKMRLVAGLIDAETKGVQKYVEAIAKCQEHRQIFKDIVDEEFQHIKLLNEIIDELSHHAGSHDESEVWIEDQEQMNEHSHEDHSNGVMVDSNNSMEMVEQTVKSQPTMVSFKRTK